MEPDERSAARGVQEMAAVLQAETGTAGAVLRAGYLRRDDSRKAQPSTLLTEGKQVFQANIRGRLPLMDVNGSYASKRSGNREADD